jgi:hypothetical protein
MANSCAGIVDSCAELSNFCTVFWAVCSVYRKIIAFAAVKFSFYNVCYTLLRQG